MHCGGLRRVGLLSVFTAALALAGVSTVASPTAAQAPPGASSRNEIEQPGEPITDDDTSIATATQDPTPPPREPTLDQEVEVDVVEQAGVGGPVPYGASSVLEVGGGGYFSGNEAELWASLRPYVGLFIVDDIQLGISNEILVRYGAPNDEVSAAFLGTVDANFYVPFAIRLWWEFGISGGGLYNGIDGGVAALARTGLVTMFGRSTVLHWLVTGGAASVPFASPVSPASSSSHFRIGGEILLGGLF